MGSVIWLIIFEVVAMSNFVPLRKFIFDRLYSPAGGYFCRKDFQVGELAAPIDFKSLIGFDDYQQQLFKRYPKNAWLTPSQIFKPYYGMSLANYIVQAEQRYLMKNPGTSPIRIVEAGAGTGSAAESILYYFQNHEQEAFKTLEYTIVEISPALCTHLEQKLKKSFPRHLERGQIRIINKDILKYQNPHRCYTIFLEVLDNLAHDKVVKNEEGLYDQYSLVNLSTRQQKYDQITNDELVKECLDLWIKCEKFSTKAKVQRKGILTRIADQIMQKYYKTKPSGKQLFLPTYLLHLVKSFKTNIPRAHFIISDFDSLTSSIAGINAPIVSFKGEGSSEKKDYPTYLVERGAADIFFPVDFYLAKLMIQTITEAQADVVKSYEFFEEFGVQNWSQSKSGFNPLREDFANTSFLVTKV